MVDLARSRTARFKDRARIRQSDGSFRFEDPGESIDRFIANYVLDVLPPEDISAAIGEAHRLLKPDGLLGVISLTHGRSGMPRWMTQSWDRIHRFRPAWVGGCRPVELLDFIGEDSWRVDYQKVITAFGIPSEIVIATKR